MQKVDNKPVGQLGRIVIPENIRDLLSMNPGDKVDLFVDGNALVIVPEGAPCTCCVCSQPQESNDMHAVGSGKKICSGCIISISAILNH